MGEHGSRSRTARIHPSARLLGHRGYWTSSGHLAARFGSLPVSLLLDRIGTDGIEVVGATRSERIKVPGEGTIVVEGAGNLGAHWHVVGSS